MLSCVCCGRQDHVITNDEAELGVCNFFDVHSKRAFALHRADTTALCTNSTQYVGEARAKYNPKARPTSSYAPLCTHAYDAYPGTVLHDCKQALMFARDHKQCIVARASQQSSRPR